MKRAIKWTAIVLGVIIVLYLIDTKGGKTKGGAELPATEKTTVKTEPEKWYEGGTLHNATMAEWKAGTEKDRLATCADFAARIKKANNQKFASEKELAEDAYYFLSFLDEVGKGDVAQNEKVAEMVAAAQILRQKQ